MVNSRVDVAADAGVVLVAKQDDHSNIKLNRFDSL